MNPFISVLIALIIIVAVLLVLIIMVQNPKGGGLSSTFGGGGFSMGGVQSTNTFLDKSTWTLAAIMVGMIILTNILLTSNTHSTTRDTRLKNEVENTVNTPEKETPAVPGTPAPEGNTPAAPAAPQDNK